MVTRVLLIPYPVEKLPRNWSHLLWDLESLTMKVLMELLLLYSLSGKKGWVPSRSGSFISRVELCLKDARYLLIWYRLLHWKFNANYSLIEPTLQCMTDTLFTLIWNACSKIMAPFTRVVKYTSIFLQDDIIIVFCKWSIFRWEDINQSRVILWRVQSYYVLWVR